MKDTAALHLPENCRYTAEHIWICPDEDTDGEYIAGISDFAQDQLGEIAFVDLPAQDSEFQAGDEFGTVESLKSVNPLFMPLGGQIIAVNEELESTPTLANISPYDQGWMIRFRPSDAAAFATAQALLDAAAYRATL